MAGSAVRHDTLEQEPVRPIKLSCVPECDLGPHAGWHGSTVTDLKRRRPRRRSVFRGQRLHSPVNPDVYKSLTLRGKEPLLKS
jgi:hypothetical protein